MLNSILIVALKPALTQTVILHVPLKKSVHPFPLKPTAVHIRSDQDTHTVQDAVLELALEGVLVLIDELTLPHYLPISIFGTRMATSSESIPVPTIGLLSKSFQGSLLVGCNCCHIVAPVFGSLDPSPLVLHLQLCVVVCLEVIDHNVIVIS